MIDSVDRNPGESGDPAAAGPGCAAVSPDRSWKLVCGASLVLVLVTAGVFHELVFRPDGLLVGTHANGRNDLTLQFLRYRDTPAELTGQSEGSWPGLCSGWDPHLGLGMPVHGNPQMALFYPPNWICFVAGTKRTISWLLVAHMGFAGLGAWTLARSAGLSWISSLLAGSIALGAPYCVAHLAEGHVAQIMTVSWIPWILVSFERFLASDGQHWKAMVLCLSMSFLAGHVQELFYLVLLLTGLVVLSSLARMRSGESGGASLLVHWGVAGMCGAALVAVDLIPVFLNSLGTARGGRLPLEQAGDGLRLENFRQLIDPFALGMPGETAQSGHTFYWTTLLYFGVIPLLLAIVGVLGSLRRPLTRHMVLMTGTGLVFALGTLTPLYGICWQFVPMIGSFRIPSRILFICSYGMAILAAAGLDALILKSRSSESRPGVTPVRTVSRITPAGCFFGLAVLAGTVGELTWYAKHVVEVAHAEDLRCDSEITRFLADQDGSFRVQTTHALLSDREALLHGIEKVRGYEPVIQVRLAWLHDALSSLPDAQLDFAGFRETRITDLHKNVADLAGIRFLITSVQQEIPAGWRLIGKGSVPGMIHLPGRNEETVGFQIYENLNFMPRAFVIGDVVETSGFAAQAAVQGLEANDPRSAVLLHHDRLSSGARADFHQAAIIEERPDQVTIRTSTQAPGYLVLNNLFHTGWQAELDGVSVDVFPANLAFCAVLLPAGEHEVVFHYECPGQHAGLILSGVMLSMLTLTGLVGRLRSRA